MSKIHDYTQTFMTTAGQTVRELPSVPTHEELELRLSLEFEELREKAEAMGKAGTFAETIMFGFFIKHLKKVGVTEGVLDMLRMVLNQMPQDTDIYNMVEVFDGALDQNVVWSGTNLAAGFKQVMAKGDREVYASNMSKFDMNFYAASKTREKYEAEGIEVYTQEVNGLFVTKRKQGHKVLKSFRYSPTVLEPILRAAVGDTYPDLRAIPLPERAKS